jgi:UTP--glucose-1-phosphate uridylyltransferase
MTTRVKKAVLPVGGLGTRFLPATKALAKEMLPVVDKPLVQYAFEEARDAGIEQFIFVMGRNKNAISNHFDHAYELQSVLNDKKKREELQTTTGWLPDAGSIVFTRQQQPLGLGHAVWCARHFIGDEPFAVLLADDMVRSDVPCLQQMMQAYEKMDTPHLIAVEEVPKEDTSKYGVLDVEHDDGKLVQAKGLVEKPAPENAPSNLAVIGRYILQSDVFTHLDKKEKGAGGEIQLTDAIMASAQSGTPTYGFRFEGMRHDCGSKIGFLEANIAYALERDDMRERTLKMLEQFHSQEQQGNAVRNAS